jgi:ankyrin repeat protein
MNEKFDAPKASLIKPELLKYAKSGDLQKVKQLIEQGANPNVSDELGNTAMDFARVRGHKDIFDYLKANGGKSKFD